MKTKEFIEKVEELGFRTTHVNEYIYIENRMVDTCAIVDRYCRYGFNTNFDDFYDLKKETKEELFNLLVEYSSTPQKEREKTNKYYLKHKWMSFKRERYLKCIGGEYYLHDAEQPTKHKVQFTQIEIDKIKEKFGTDLNDFEMIEAKGE